MNLIEFKIMHSETVMYYQIIENDLKLIYTCRKYGNVNYENFRKTENMTLGTVINVLKELDNSDGKPWISASDYNFLKQIKENRNFWAHHNFLDFIYEGDSENSDKYSKQCQKLKKDHKRLGVVYKNLEDIRIEVLRNNV